MNRFFGINFRCFEMFTSETQVRSLDICDGQSGTVTFGPSNSAFPCEFYSTNGAYVCQFSCLFWTEGPADETTEPSDKAMLFRKSGALDRKLFSNVWLPYNAAMLGLVRFSFQGLLRFMKNSLKRRYVTEILSFYEIHHQNCRQTPLIRNQNWRLQCISHWSDLALVIHFDCVLKTRLVTVSECNLWREDELTVGRLSAVQCQTNRRSEAASSGNIWDMFT